MIRLSRHYISSSGFGQIIVEIKTSFVVEEKDAWPAEQRRVGFEDDAARDRIPIPGDGMDCTVRYYNAMQDCTL